MGKSKKLHKARVTKNDEFYTQYCDIESECNNYIEQFRDKVIYCNCDTADSNFVKYFKELKHLGKIKDVMYSGGLDGLDFRSPESIELLNQADIVISNPPFSLFREYIKQLIEYDKKFLIIGSKNAISYHNLFRLIKDNKIKPGIRPFSGGMLFEVPNPQDLLETGKKGETYAIVNGEIKARIPAIWFTNLKCERRKQISLSKIYKGNEKDYPRYDNYDAINVNKVSDIPNDYYGVIGVPITFIDKYNPEQFKIMGLDKEFTSDKKGVSINGKNLYTRIFIQRKIAVISNDNDLIKMAA